jgi:hypothetical protein
MPPLASLVTSAFDGLPHPYLLIMEQAEVLSSFCSAFNIDFWEALSCLSAALYRDDKMEFAQCM